MHKQTQNTYTFRIKNEQTSNRKEKKKLRKIKQK